MRLIDADGMLDVFDVLEAPTIEAIPVKWLEEEAHMYEELSEHTTGIWGEIYDEWAHLLRQLIEKWRKDNEG